MCIEIHGYVIRAAGVALWPGFDGWPDQVSARTFEADLEAMLW